MTPAARHVSEKVTWKAVGVCTGIAGSYYGFSCFALPSFHYYRHDEHLQAILKGHDSIYNHLTTVTSPLNSLSPTPPPTDLTHLKVDRHSFKGKRWYWQRVAWCSYKVVPVLDDECVAPVWDSEGSPRATMYITAEWRNADGTPSRWWQRGFHYQMDYFGLKKYNSKCGWYLTSAVCVLDKKRSLTHILADAACRLLPSKIKSWVATDADTENNESTPTLTTAPRSLIQLDGDVATMQPVTKWNVIERPPKRIEEKGTQGASPAASPSPSTSSESSSSSTNPPLTTSQPSSPAPPPASSISWPSTTASNPFYNKLLVVLHGHPRSHPQLSVRLDTDIAAKRELLFQRDRYARKFFYLTGCFMLCLVFQRIPIWLAKNEIKALQVM
eukprot:GHVN01057663.1.p1 GENE.GHVN01057663.1~~GHVN01057663.1.p1  ORF type:complete len:385 (-),score=66.33 GHVN01057663.1:972-2126(-)